MRSQSLNIFKSHCTKPAELRGVGEKFDLDEAAFNISQKTKAL